MTRFQVNPDELAAGQGLHDAAAGAILGAAALTRRAAAAIAGAGGHPAACAAGAEWGATWEGELVNRVEVLRRAGANLVAAADAYRETDAGQMRT